MEPTEAQTLGPTTAPDPDLVAAVAEVEEFAAAAGWDVPPRMFALVSTADLLVAEPGLAGTVGDGSRYTPIAQDDLPEGDLSEALAHISWGEEVAGCVLVQEILMLPPAAAAGLDADPAVAAQQAAAHPDRNEARLVAGVLRDSPAGACLLRLRGEHHDTPISGPELAPLVLQALHSTFAD